MIRVLIADDHPVVRRGLAQILDEEEDLTRAGEAGDAGAVLKAIRQKEVDVLLLDIAMPGGGGLEVLRQLQDLRPDLPVLVLSVYAEKQYAVRALRAGAAGYLTKEGVPKELVDAIRRVARGKRYITPSLAGVLAERVSDEATTPYEVLSDREFQVMRMLAEGQTVTGIAEELSLSTKTVSTYRTRIMQKLHLDSTGDIIRHALQHGLVE